VVKRGGEGEIARLEDSFTWEQGSRDCPAGKVLLYSPIVAEGTQSKLPKRTPKTHFYSLAGGHQAATWPYDFPEPIVNKLISSWRKEKGPCFASIGSANIWSIVDDFKGDILRLIKPITYTNFSKGHLDYPILFYNSFLKYMDAFKQWLRQDDQNKTDFYKAFKRQEGNQQRVIYADNVQGLRTDSIEKQILDMFAFGINQDIDGFNIATIGLNVDPKEDKANIVGLVIDDLVAEGVLQKSGNWYKPGPKFCELYRNYVQ